MPYIPPYDRTKLDEAMENLDPINAGELNYVITTILLDYLGAKGAGYNWMNEVVGVLECVKLELYRRALAPYEDQKAKINGDVY